MIPAEKASTIPSWLSGTGPESDIVLSTRARLARCLADHTFPPKSSLLERRTILQKVTAAVGQTSECEGCENVDFAHLDVLEQEFLLENRAVSPEFLGLDGDRGVIHDEKYRLGMMINEEDHLRIQCVDSGFAASELWADLSAIDDSLGEKLKWAFDPKRGYLTCSPGNSGTGLCVSYLLHLPGLVLTRTIDQVLVGASQMGIATRGFWGDNSAVTGNFFQLSNAATVGRSEIEFVQDVADAVRVVVDCERAARERILADARLELEDKVHRAYGILLHARTLSVGEFLNLSSALRMGIECGIFDKVRTEVLNHLTVLCMPAHLQVHANKQMAEADVAVLRAQVVQEFLVS